MKTSTRTAGVLALAFLGMLAGGPALAQHHGHGHGHGGGVRFGISIGMPIYTPAYYRVPYYAYPAPAYVYPGAAYVYPAPAYSYPATAIASPSPVYVERATVTTAPAQAQPDWYYCNASNSYYPYVTDCPSGWQRVQAQPR